ncbi:Pesticidal crystal cry3Ba [Fusarium pseudoanthophilum]|uniref:Pesticidal crystal cry3Ba n=1 Tax=Fusarium pseudoanthophilum TaxID=48495 RepID=A0A8H5KF81_9HYPO|nr:Pesticidal crystal cry3Ba [Fusarium pseudoanthophilum]
MWEKLRDRIEALVDTKIAKTQMVILRKKIRGFRDNMENCKRVWEDYRDLAGEEQMRARDTLKTTHIAFLIVVRTTIPEFRVEQFALQSDSMRLGRAWGYSEKNIDTIYPDFKKKMSPQGVTGYAASITSERSHLLKVAIARAINLEMPTSIIDTCKGAYSELAVPASGFAGHAKGYDDLDYASYAYEINPADTLKAYVDYNSGRPVIVLNHVEYWLYLAGDKTPDYVLRKLDREIYFGPFGCHTINAALSTTSERIVCDRGPYINSALGKVRFWNNRDRALECGSGKNGSYNGCAAPPGYRLTNAHITNYYTQRLGKRMLESIFLGGGVRRFNSVHEKIPIDITSEVIEQSLAVLQPEDFLSQALRYLKHCDLNPAGHHHERRLTEIMQRLDDKYGEFLKSKNLLEFTAQQNWLEEAIKVPIEGSMRSGHNNNHAKLVVETPEDRYRNQLEHTIDSELEALTGVQKKSRPKDLELLTLCPVTIKRSFTLLKPFDYTERYSLHYILLRKYSGDGNLTHEEADREAKILLNEYKAEHFESLCEESRELTEWQEREKVRDWKYWKESEYDRRANSTGYDESEDNESQEDGSEDEEPEDEESGDDESEDEEAESGDDESGGDESEGDESEGEEAESEGDGVSSSAGMDIDLPEPTSEDLTTQISVLQISNKKSNGEAGGVTKTAKKRPLDDSDDADEAAASGYKRAKMEHWRKRFDPRWR